MNEIERLKRYKDKKGISYEGLAKELDGSFRTVFRWLKGESKPGRAWAKLLNKFLQSKGF